MPLSIISGKAQNLTDPYCSNLTMKENHRLRLTGAYNMHLKPKKLPAFTKMQNLQLNWMVTASNSLNTWDQD